MAARGSGRRSNDNHRYGGDESGERGANANDINNNTFLSRVFGMNSSYPVNTPLFTDDTQAELSLYHDHMGDDDSHEHQTGRDYSRNTLNSDEEDYFNNDDNSDDSYNESHGYTERRADDDYEDDEDFSNDGEEDDDDEEAELIPESLMVEHDNRDHHNHKGHHHHNHQHHHKNKNARGNESSSKFPVKSILMKNTDNNGPNLHEFTNKARELATNTFNRFSSTAAGPTDQEEMDYLPPPGSMQHKFNKQKKKQEKALRNRLGILTPLERSLWLWANITNLDIFLADVYKYYIGKGFQCILVENICDVLTLIFILFLAVYMGNCIDYDILLNDNPTKFSEVRVDKCYTKIPASQKFLIFTICTFIALKVRNFVFKELPKLIEIRNFYRFLLNVKDDELQTISWNSIVKKIMVLRDQNTTAVISENFAVINDDLKSKKRLNAHDIANRIMRKDNYMIALFNKNVLNLSIPIISKKTNGFLTKTLEWNLNLCIFDFIFDSKTGQLQKKFLKEQNRLQLAKELKNRFILAGILNILLSPFVVTYFIMYYSLKFFYEFRYNPTLINNREYTPLAMWKFREFNELEHLFKKRLNLSSETASVYINQFPRKKVDIILRFCSFVSGSLLTILVILTIFDPESFLNFELTNKRTVLFYISALGAVYTVCQNSIHDENVVFDPELKMGQLHKYTHYLPKEWEGKLHTEEVKFEFATFYNLKVIIILKELASLVLSPLILFYSLPKSSTRIIDFFREFTVHVDELGYVCHFAMFNFEKTKDKLRSDYYQSNDDKMMKSYLYFVENINNDENMDQAHFESSIFNENSSAVTFKQTHNGHPQSAGIHNNNNHNNNAASARRRQVSNLRNSYIMEESFDNQLLASSSRDRDAAVGFHNGATQKNDDDEDDDEDEDEDDGGVLKFVNQFYSKR